MACKYAPAAEPEAIVLANAYAELAYDSAADEPMLLYEEPSFVNSHLSIVSFQRNCVGVESPRITLNPAFSVGIPVAKLLFKSIVLSARAITSVLIVVTWPDTVRLPEIFKSPEIVPPDEDNLELAVVYAELAYEPAITAFKSAVLAVDSAVLA